MPIVHATRGKALLVLENGRSSSGLQSLTLSLPGQKVELSNLWSSKTQKLLCLDRQGKTCILFNVRQCCLHIALFLWLQALSKTCFICLCRWGSCSIIHYVEEKLNVPYRYWKTFTGNYKPAGSDTFEERSCKFFARQFEPFEWDTCMDPVGDLLEESGNSTYQFSTPSRLRAFFTFGPLNAYNYESYLCNRRMSLIQSSQATHKPWSLALPPAMWVCTRDKAARPLMYYRGWPCCLQCVCACVCVCMCVCVYMCALVSANAGLTWTEMGCYPWRSLGGTAGPRLPVEMSVVAVEGAEEEYK